MDSPTSITFKMQLVLGHLVYIGYEGKFLHRKGCQALEQDAQESTGVTIPEGI